MLRLLPGTVSIILIPFKTVDKICEETVPIARKRDDGVLYVRLGALTKQEARNLSKDIHFLKRD